MSITAVQADMPIDLISASCRIDWVWLVYMQTRLPRAAVSTTCRSSRSDARSWLPLQPTLSRHMHHFMMNISMLPSTTTISLSHRIQFHEMISLHCSAHQSPALALTNHLDSAERPIWLAPFAIGCLIAQLQESSRLHSLRS